MSRRRGRGSRETFADLVVRAAEEIDGRPAPEPFRGPGWAEDGSLVAPDGVHYRETPDPTPTEGQVRDLARAGVWLLVDACDWPPVG